VKEGWDWLFILLQEMILKYILRDRDRDRMLLFQVDLQNLPVLTIEAYNDKSRCQGAIVTVPLNQKAAAISEWFVSSMFFCILKTRITVIEACCALDACYASRLILFLFLVFDYGKDAITHRTHETSKTSNPAISISCLCHGYSHCHS
jgi:hypothetical protein